MNKNRRKRLAKVKEKMELLEELLESIYTEEWDALENVPHMFYGTAKYRAMEDAVTNITLAIDHLRNAVDYTEEAMM